MNLPEQSEKLIAEIKSKAKEFALDNGFTSEQSMLIIESAMMIGAITASGHCAQIQEAEQPFCCCQRMITWDFTHEAGKKQTIYVCGKCGLKKII